MATTATSHACPGCNQPMNVPEHLLGREVICPRCQQRFTPLAGGGSTTGSVATGSPQPGATLTCPRCRATVVPGSSYCGVCGGAVSHQLDPAQLARRPALISVLSVLMFFAAVVTVLFAAGFGLAAADAHGEGQTVLLVVVLVMAMIALLQAICGYGLWTMKPFGRTLLIVLAVPGLLAIPVGTIISVLILIYLFRPEIKLLFSGRSREQFSEAELAQLAASTSASSGLGVAVVAITAVLIVAIMMSGIIAAIAVPNLLTAINRGRQKRTMADIRTVATALEAYAADHNAYPPGITSMEELKPLLTPDYLAMLPMVDGWRTPLVVTTDGDGVGYEIISYGRDLEPGEPVGDTPQECDDFDCDIVYRNGQFMQFPAGTGGY